VPSGGRPRPAARRATESPTEHRRCADGLRTLARRQQPKALSVAMVLVYIGLSVRLVQVFALFRLPV
jgi:hypothetical protein